MVKELPPGYYLDNFMQVLDFVDQFYADILSEEEQAFSLAFRSCTKAAKQLYVRLISRKGPHFRSDKLNYAEIPFIHSAVEVLEEAGLLVVNRPLPSEELAGLLLRGELLDVLHELTDGSPAQLRGMRKLELVEEAASLDPARLLALVMDHYFSVYTPLGVEAMIVYRLLFFGNLHQDLTEFVLLDLGLLRYEAYEINREDRLFSRREIVDTTLSLYGLRLAAYEAMEEEDPTALDTVLQALPEVTEPGLMRRRDRILNRCGAWLERKKDYEGALRCFERSSSPPARERRARIHDRHGDHEEALALCEAAFAEPGNEMEWEFAERFRAKQQKKLGLPVQSPPKVKHPEYRLTLVRDLDRCIEPVVLDYFTEQGVEGFYSENHFWRGLFGLAFWDLIFMPVRGAFFNRFQRGPMGLFSPEFRKDRAAAVAARLEEIGTDPQWPLRVLAVWREKFGVANYLVHWPSMSEEVLKKVLAVVDRGHLSAILDRFSRNPGEFKTGFPDLFLFKDEGGYELVEVKGPGDQLQPNQKRWLRFFAEQGIPYRLARVSWRVDGEE